MIQMTSKTKMFARSGIALAVVLVFTLTMSPAAATATESTTQTTQNTATVDSYPVCSQIRGDTHEASDTRQFCKDTRDEVISAAVGVLGDT